MMIGIAVLILTIFVGISYRQWELYRRANADSERSREIVAAIDAVLISTTDAETGQRGFLLTGEDRYLEPYNRALQELPNDLAALNRLLGNSQGFDELNSLTRLKLDELRQTIEVRRTRGQQSALAIVLTDQGKRTMDSIRALCEKMKRNERAGEARAFADREAAAGVALLITVAGSMVLLFLFALRFEPFASADPIASGRSWVLRYGVAIVAVVAFTLIRAALTPLMGPMAMPFTLYFCAVGLAAWFGGFRPALLSIVLSALAGSWFFAAPVGSLWVSGHDDQVAMLTLVLFGFGVALLSRSQRNAVRRASQAEESERNERQRFEITLASIGDAVIAANSIGKVMFLNREAERLTGWKASAAQGKDIKDVFPIFNAKTGDAMKDPVREVTERGVVVEIGNNSALRGASGQLIPIEDSAAPIRDHAGELVGVVLVFRDVTSKVHLQQKSMQLASIVASSEDAILSKDLNGVVTSWNESAQRMFGYIAEEMVGQSVVKLYPPGREHEMHEILDRIERGERVEHYRAVRRRKDGTHFDVSLTVSPLFDEDGVIIGASKIVRDITEQVRAQNALTLERERLSVTLASIGDAVIATDVLGHISYLNPVAEELTGWRSEEAVGRPLSEVFTIVNEQTRQPALNPAERALKEGRVVGLANHTVLITKDGREVAIDDSAAPIRGEKSEVLGVVLVFRDITEKRAAENLLAAQAAELRDEHERLNLALKAGRMGIFEMDLARNVLWWSEETYALFGADPKLECTFDSFISLVDPRDRAMLTQNIQESIDLGQPINHEFRILGREQNERWIICQARIDYDQQGNAVCCYGIFIDITLRKQSEQMVRKFERLSSAARLSAALAHEINNPLGAVVNLIFLAKSAAGVPASVVEQLSQAEQELERVAHVTRQTLGFYRESNATEEVDVPVLIDSLLNIYSKKIAEKQISVVRTFGQCPFVQAVRGELRQVLSNIITNAIEAVRESGTIQIDTHSAPGSSNKSVEVIIADDGPGISDRDLDRIFEPFFSTKPGTGTGLGLWVAREIVMRHGGNIQVVPKKDRVFGLCGAMFKIQLPSRSKPLP